MKRKEKFIRRQLSNTIKVVVIGTRTFSTFFSAEKNEMKYRRLGVKFKSLFLFLLVLLGSEGRRTFINVRNQILLSRLNNAGVSCCFSGFNVLYV